MSASSSAVAEENQENTEGEVNPQEQPQPVDLPEVDAQQAETQPLVVEEQQEPEDQKEVTLEPDQGADFVGVPQEEEKLVIPTEESKQEEGAGKQEEEEDAKQPAEEELGEPILEPSEHDVLNGRGASVNAHRGNTKFRALCFARKPEFEAGNHAAKRRVATEIVSVTKALPGRFLKRKQDKGPWYELSTEKSILKACQVMRDFQRPDRLALREMTTANGGRKRQRTSESTPGVNAPPAVPLAPIVENPYGVHDHDVLSGRGAFVNGHVGNARFRQLAIDRKAQFDGGNYSEKRALATEIVSMIRSLNPSGRFLKRMAGNRPKAEEEVADGDAPARGIEGGWEELSDDRAIHKACQVMRDLQRPDRTGERKSGFRKTARAALAGGADEEEGVEKVEDDGVDVDESNMETNMEATVDATATETTAAEEAVLATEQVLDKALADTVPPIEAPVDHIKEEDEPKAPVEMMQV
eukprot:CAMPEP_0119018368 /NCGR_PEP_ID=MMETSP1176-20130426/19214_1 /TAXON_ID=265551 /ORGANISM="Synedropsis recta cf, Strain CCMP1620" /LENGTH=468 /DNA_ID=CAMNT_0006972353 /DNA_START=36 /DNA_END=1442 /DNA_ORIENTATION=+